MMKLTTDHDDAQQHQHPIGEKGPIIISVGRNHKRTTQPPWYYYAHNRNTAHRTPYNSSIVLLALVAFLSPFVSFLWSLPANDDYHYHHHDDDDSSNPYHRRHLQSNDCNTNTTSASTTTNNLSSTWEAIRYTTAISSAVALLCLVGYESFRRDPIVGKYVYDRKRLVQPDRTPPPLMLSRSLWRGYHRRDEDRHHHHRHHDEDDHDAEDGKEGSEENEEEEVQQQQQQQQQEQEHTTSYWKWYFKVPPAILEIIFLNLDGNYIRYSRAAHEARMERERMGYMTCCMTGCFHNNCCNNHVYPSSCNHGGGGSGCCGSKSRRRRRRRRLLMLEEGEEEGDGDFFVDEDGYAFFPGYCGEYSHIYEHRNRNRNNNSDDDDDNDGENDDTANNNDDNLFPEVEDDDDAPRGRGGKATTTTTTTTRRTFEEAARRSSSNSEEGRGISPTWNNNDAEGGLVSSVVVRGKKNRVANTTPGTVRWNGSDSAGGYDYDDYDDDDDAKVKSSVASSGANRIPSLHTVELDNAAGGASDDTSNRRTSDTNNDDDDDDNDASVVHSSESDETTTDDDDDDEGFVGTIIAEETSFGSHVDLPDSSIGGGDSPTGGDGNDGFGNGRGKGSGIRSARRNRVREIIDGTEEELGDATVVECDVESLEPNSIEGDSPGEDDNDESGNGDSAEGNNAAEDEGEVRHHFAEEETAAIGSTESCSVIEGGDAFATSCVRSSESTTTRRSSGSVPSSSVEVGVRDDDDHDDDDVNVETELHGALLVESSTSTTTSNRDIAIGRDARKDDNQAPEDDIHAEAALRGSPSAERPVDGGNPAIGIAIGTESGEDDNDEGTMASPSPAETKPLKYPSRLLYICLPPGFHSWTNVLLYVGYFFYLPGVVRLCRKILKPWLSAGSRGCDDDDDANANANNNDTNTNNTPQSNNTRRNAIPIENPGKKLTEGEEELLRCAGLDTYLLVRLARFGFDVTFYPYCFAFVTILPLYQSCVGEDNPTVDGYLNLTINVIPNEDRRMIGVVFFTCLLYVYILRRLWYEWEVFIQLRHKFLANGDTSFHKSPSYLRTYRNTSMVECVPKTLRSDKDLRDVFESLFPGQIERAEMLINTSKLEEILKKRQVLIEKYDSISARYLYESWKYDTWQRDGKHVGTCTNYVSKPAEPKVRSGGIFSKKEEDAFAYYNQKIEEINKKADEEYNRIIEQREKIKNDSILASENAWAERGEESHRRVGYNVNDIVTLLVPSNIRQLVGEEPKVFFGTGIVEFKSIAAKQSAVQCNLSGQPYWMITNDAPDPRDLFWSNVGVDRYTLETRKILVQSVLLLGILGWGAIVTFITSLTTGTFDSIASDYVHYGLIKDYLPALAVSLILLWLPAIFLLLAMHVIRFKSHSQCDEFVLIWNTGYRLANVFLTLFSISFMQAFQCFKESPDVFLQQLADGVVRQSTVLMNLVILAAGQETMLQLLQWRSLIKQALFRPLINLNTRSRRYIDRLNAAPVFEQSFLFGFFAPVLSYGLMIAMIYSFMAPLMLAICAIFFYVATKVHTHNALFVYCQRCEGGGKIFCYWNRIVFITLYSSIVLFSAILFLKKYPEIGTPFFVIMTLITYCIDKSVTNTFVVNSLYLPISIARIHDIEEDELINSSDMGCEGGEKFMYHHPLLNQENWNSKI